MSVMPLRLPPPRPPRSDRVGQFLLFGEWVGALPWQRRRAAPRGREELGIVALRGRGLVWGRAAALVAHGMLVAALVGCSGGADQNTGAGPAPIVEATTTAAPSAAAAGATSASAVPRSSASSTGKPSASASHSAAAAVEPAH